MAPETDKDREEADCPTKGKETRNTVILALSFYATFTAFHALQSLQSSLNPSHNLGVISLSVIYGTFVLSGILAPTVIRFLGIKATILVSFVVHLIYTSSNFYPAFFTLIPSSALLGGISGFLWTSQSTYVTVCAYSRSKHSGEDLYTALSSLTGLFYSIFGTTQIPGNLISSLVLRFGTFSNGTHERVCGPSFCPSTMNSTGIPMPDETVVYIMLGVFLACNITAILITCVFLSPLPKSVWIASASLKESLSSFFETAFATKLIFLVPLILYLSVSSSFLSVDYTRSYISCPVGIHMVGFTMAIYGGTNALSSFIFSRLVKFTGRFVLFGIGSSLHAGLFTILYLWTPGNVDTKFIFLLPIAWGAADGIFTTQTLAVIALMFPDRKEPAFANFHTWQAVGSTMMFALGSVLCVRAKLIIIYVGLALSMTFYAGVEIHHKSYRKNKEGYEQVNS